METERILADTNLFLRYLTNDIPEQADAVERLLHTAAAGEVTLVVNELVLAEIVWTLESFYRRSRAAIKESILAILGTPGLEIASRETVLQAISWYAEKGVDFIDAYNAAWLLRQGMTTICSFDRKHFARLEGIVMRVPGAEHG
jgi:predicted nucleic-acid-binding protein